MALDPQAAKDLRLLTLESTTQFAFSASGRILRENDPDGSPGPRVFFASCAGGNLARVRHDVDDRAAEVFLRLADEEPAWNDETTRPSFLDAVIAQISAGSRAKPEVAALCHRLPNGLASDFATMIVSSGTAEGSALQAGLAREMPPHLIEAGFLTTGDLWEPWCAAIEGGKIAALAFAARTGAGGLEVGVYTFPEFRGRGLAAAVTAAWSRLPSLTSKTLFYSCSAANRSSRRVVQRLGLRRIGLSLRIV